MLKSPAIEAVAEVEVAYPELGRGTAEVVERSDVIANAEQRSQAPSLADPSRDPGEALERQRTTSLRTALSAGLICLGLAALSCGAGSPVQTTLPSVDAGPPARSTAAKQPPQAIASADDEARALAITQVLAKLRRRHTAMPHHELPELAATIVREAHRNDLEPALVMAVIEVESSFYHRAVSSVGALGLMQLLPSTAAEIARARGARLARGRLALRPDSQREARHFLPEGALAALRGPATRPWRRTTGGRGAFSGV